MYNLEHFIFLSERYNFFQSPKGVKFEFNQARLFLWKIMMEENAIGFIPLTKTFWKGKERYWDFIPLRGGMNFYSSYKVLYWEYFYDKVHQKKRGV